MPAPDLIPQPFEADAFRDAVVVFHRSTAVAVAITPQAALESGKRLIEAAQKALAPDAPLLRFGGDD